MREGRLLSYPCALGPPAQADPSTSQAQSRHDPARHNPGTIQARSSQAQSRHDPARHNPGTIQPANLSPNPPPFSNKFCKFVVHPPPLGTNFATVLHTQRHKLWQSIQSAGHASQPGAGGLRWTPASRIILYYNILCYAISYYI